MKATFQSPAAAFGCLAANNPKGREMMYWSYPPIIPAGNRPIRRTPNENPQHPQSSLGPVHCDQVFASEENGGSSQPGTSTGARGSTFLLKKGIYTANPVRDANFVLIGFSEVRIRSYK